MTSRKPCSSARRVRDAITADNDQLLCLAKLCPMEGHVAICVNRAPDFFALNRLEGDRWRVGVVDGPAGTIAGCIAVAERNVYLDGRPARVMYVSDLKVHPAHRDGWTGNALIRYAQEACRRAGGDDAPILSTILANNQPMERRIYGPRGLPRLTRFATIRTYSVPLLWRRPRAGADLRVSRAKTDDIEEMAALWRRLGPSRQFAPVHDGKSFAEWIDRAPSLSPSCYWLARRDNGRLAGFVGLWDQTAFKQLRVTGYSARLAAFRALFNALAPALHVPALPPPGGELRHLTAIHMCVSADEPAVLRSLLVHAYNELRGCGFSFFNVGLDIRDPLAAALKGLLAQVTDTHAYVTTPAGCYSGPALDHRPLHYEIALV